MKFSKLIVVSLSLFFVIPTVVFAEDGNAFESSTKTSIEDTTVYQDVQAIDEITINGAGEWDPMGQESFYVTMNGIVETKLIYSGGGLFKMRFSNVTFGNRISVWLYDQDPGEDDPIPPKSAYIESDGDLIFDVSNFVDGDNGKVELYAHIGWASDLDEFITVEYFD
jgi:hypothetical protein